MQHIKLKLPDCCFEVFIKPNAKGCVYSSLNAREQRLVDDAMEAEHFVGVYSTEGEAARCVAVKAGINPSTFKNRLSRMSWQEAVDMGKGDKKRCGQRWRQYGKKVREQRV